MARTQSANIDQQLAELESATRAELIAWFEAEFGHSVAPKTSARFLRSNLAWNWQARAEGHDPDQLRKALRQKLYKAVHGTPRQRAASRPGTRLVREWQGRVHEVTVLEQGYAWQGQVYRSLSQVATEITGTKWSGPRFFGLKAARQ